MKTVSTICGLVIAGALFTGCATLFTGKTTPVILVNAPKDLKVYEDGRQLDITRVQSQVKSGYTTTTYYTSGVELAKKQKHHLLTFESNGVKKNT